MTKSRWLELFTDERVIAAIFAVVTLGTTLQKYFSGHANNLHIFRASFFNLIAGRDLYSLHPEQHWDYFKYSPTFALFMAPFSWLPQFASAIAWNFCNVFALFAAIRLLPLDQRQKGLVLWLIAIELLTSIQNFQSNALIAALIIGTFICFERGWPEAAALCVILAAFVKIFGLAAGLLVFFYPRKGRFFMVAVVAGILFLVAPLLVVPLEELRWQYRSWFELLRIDYEAKEKLSVMSWLRGWFGADLPNSAVQIFGASLLLLALLWRNRYSDRAFRLRFLASLLVFLVIFNHKAESPMFILAVSGVAIWYAASDGSTWRMLLMGFVVVVTSLATTDLLPRHIRETWISPFAVKTFPCIVAWFAVQVELLTNLSLRESRHPPV